MKHELKEPLMTIFSTHCRMTYFKGRSQCVKMKGLWTVTTGPMLFYKVHIQEREFP